MNHEDYIYNRDQVEEKMRMVKNSLYGYNTPLSEYVCEKKSDLSDEKIEELADRLIGIMVGYGIDYQYGIGGAHRRCLKLYLYLIIRAYGGRVKSFGDILEVADNLMRSHNSLEELILYETDWKPGDDMTAVHEDEDEDEFYSEYQNGYKTRRYPRYGRGFFGYLDQSYEILTGHRIGDEMTEQEMQEIWDRYMVSKQRRYKKYDHLYLEDEYRDIREWSERQADIVDDEIRFASGGINDKVMPSYRILTEKEQEAYRRKEMQEKEKWKESLQEPEKFIEAYKEFRDLYFSIGFDRDGLSEAIIHFLCAEGKSCLTDSERFLRVHIQLDKAHQTAGKR